ncbi:hypothetical protein B0T13DRAFT_506247 [Neurospora crassa]|nr:hypothetical protein B0T13DRAFT_506247 [Neurospora crassa]
MGNWGGNGGGGTDNKTITHLPILEDPTSRYASEFPDRFTTAWEQTIAEFQTAYPGHIIHQNFGVFYISCLVYRFKKSRESSSCFSRFTLVLSLTLPHLNSQPNTPFFSSSCRYVAFVKALMQGQWVPPARFSQVSLHKSRGPSARMELRRAAFGAQNFGSYLISKSGGQGTGSLAFATAHERFVHVSAPSSRNCGDRNRYLLKVDSLVRIAHGSKGSILWVVGLGSC